MIKITYAYSENSLINPFIERQIREANLEGYPLTKWTIETNPMLVEHHNITRWHTVIFRDSKGDEISRLEEPFDSNRLEEALQEAKGILANKLKGEVL
ncbi:hypothetical protein [Bacillus wiedmannii]|uniref:hypothetical protein n=1 Tax=Bacillus wiedmannii TaxID=1890302 RepID=UPI000BF0C3CA|nr:hypothetical protein [Bacillus wiedmannii]PEN61581.1 hypothetical protein CN576_21330 [Bacillus wiedmannii]PHA62827.1 hypothetical protein COE75_16435 [Bacillus wiedmannii]